MTRDKIGEIKRIIVEEGKSPTDELLKQRMSNYSRNPLYWMDEAIKYRDDVYRTNTENHSLKSMVTLLQCILLAMILFVVIQLVIIWTLV